MSTVRNTTVGSQYLKKVYTDTIVAGFDPNGQPKDLTIASEAGLSLSSATQTKVVAGDIDAVVVTNATTAVNNELVVPRQIVAGGISTGAITSAPGEFLALNADATIASGSFYAGDIQAARLDLTTNKVNLSALASLGRFTIVKDNDEFVLYQDGVVFTGGVQYMRAHSDSKWLFDLSSPTLAPTDTFTILNSDTQAPIGVLSGLPGQKGCHISVNLSDHVAQSTLNITIQSASTVLVNTSLNFVHDTIDGSMNSESGLFIQGAPDGANEAQIAAQEKSLLWQVQGGVLSQDDTTRAKWVLKGGNLQVMRDVPNGDGTFTSVEYILSIQDDQSLCLMRSTVAEGSVVSARFN